MGSYDILERTVALEGGWSDHPADPGGPTAFGVTAWTLAEHRGIPRPPKNKPAEVKAFFDRMRPIVAALTLEEAKQILYERYVKKPGIDKIEPFELAQQVADISVNSGPRRAILMLQETLQKAGQAVAADGRLGPQTLGAIKAITDLEDGAELLMDALAIERANFYVSLGKKVFIRGWLRRAAVFAATAKTRQLILEMA